MRKHVIGLALWALLCYQAAVESVEVQFMETGKLSEQVRLLDALKNPHQREVSGYVRN